MGQFVEISQVLHVIGDSFPHKHVGGPVLGMIARGRIDTEDLYVTVKHPFHCVRPYLQVLAQILISIVIFSGSRPEKDIF